MNRKFIRQAEALVGSPLVLIKEIDKGVNSKIFKVTAEDKKTYCVKQYVQRTGDRRDRLGTEFAALEFLWNKGIRSIPKPIAHDPGKTFGVYSFIKGQSLRNKQVSDAYLSQALSFLAQLHALQIKTRLPYFSNASEACFTMNELMKNIQLRKTALQKVSKQNPTLHTFLTKQWEPAWNRAVGQFIKVNNDNNVRLSAKLPIVSRILSPSDFGFHNAIVDSRGKLTFVDFEYFGWDDPAKLIADFLLHPGMRLTQKQKNLFLRKAARIYKNDPTLAKRFAGVYVLLGLKWSLIILNCFLVSDKNKNWKKICTIQLKKAKTHLEALERTLNNQNMPVLSL